MSAKYEVDEVLTDVYDPDTKTIKTSQSAGSNGSIGNITDSAVVTDANGTVIGFLRGLIKIFADIWNSTLHGLKVVEQNTSNAFDEEAGVVLTEKRYTPVYIATAGDNKIISAVPAYLEKITIGKDVASSIIEVSDSATDGDGNIKLHKEGDALMTANGGEIYVNALFSAGIAADHDAQTFVTYWIRVD